MMTAGANPNRSANEVPEKARRGVGIVGHKPDGVGSGIGMRRRRRWHRIESVLGLRDDQAAVHAHDAPRLAQDDLDLAWVLIPSAANWAARGDGSIARRSTTLPLGFGNDFVGHGDDIARLQPDAGHFDGIADQRTRSSPARTSGNRRGR